MSKIRTACCTGGLHTICLSKAGYVYSFGYGNYGQLGLGEETSITNFPIQITHLPIITQISCGYFFTICIDELGNLWSFGENNKGQLGLGNTENQNIPQQILNIPPIIQISCGSNHTVCLTNKNKIWTFGCNHEAQLCIYPINKFESSPIKTKFRNIKNISAGGYQTILQQEKKILYFGCTVVTNRYNFTPREIPEVPFNYCFNEGKEPNIISISCGVSHTLFLDDEGFAYGLGANKDSRLGITYHEGSSYNIATKINFNRKIKKIFATLQNSYVIDEDNHLWSAGSNSHGQMGTEKCSISNCSLFMIKDIDRVKYVATGHGKHVLFNSSYEIWALGNNDYGQLGLSDYVQRNIPEKLDYSHIFGKMRSNSKSARK